MKKLLSLLLVTIYLLGMTLPAYAFVVRNIQFNGLQRVSPATAENYLPIKRGQSMGPKQATQILKALYKSGSFDKINLSQSGSTLVIDVVERPTIGQLKINGNSVIPTDKLTSVMRSMDIVEGRVYNPAELEKLKQGLLAQYYQLGRYNARVKITTVPMIRNRVLVDIDISEGLVAKVRHISIIGNHVFSEKTLIKEMDLTTVGLYTFFTQTDRYSEEKLDSSVEKIRNYYLDHGYLRAQIKSAQAEVSPDRKSIYITIVVSEGEPYTIEKYEFAGKTILTKEELNKLVRFKTGERFSRQKIVDTQKLISQALGNQAYIFSSTSIKPIVNNKNHTVKLIFEINPGKRAYVRHITFSNNTRTNDVVLRRETLQMEGAPAATNKLDDSKQRMLMLPYIKESEMTIQPVPGVDDQVDVNYKVKEDSAAQATFKLGYSANYGFILGAGLNQKNFLGTGNAFGLNISKSKYEEFYGMDYTNPYYTEDGISRSLSFSVSRTDPNKVGQTSGYTFNQYNLGVLFGIPIGEERRAINRIQAGLSYQGTMFTIFPRSASNQVLSFINAHGKNFNQADFKLGYSRDSRDRAIFATSGSIQSIFMDFYAPISSRSLTFYTLNYGGRWYQPIAGPFIFLGKTNLGYGNAVGGEANFPFFKHYYAGGVDTVRGYQAFSLGPMASNSTFENPIPVGGNILTTATASVIFPNYISDSVRTSVFVDAGNVYSTINNRQFGGNSTNAGPLRYSAGLEVDWLTPFGPIQISGAVPINKQKIDQPDYFQLSFGANF